MMMADRPICRILQHHQQRRWFISHVQGILPRFKTMSGLRLGHRAIFSGKTNILTSASPAAGCRLCMSNKSFRSLSTNKRLVSSNANATKPIKSNEPTKRQLRLVALHAAIPMMGFGFMDNIVMIQAGEAIDMSLGVAFSLSTLTAAGFGQCVSDVAGYTCGGIVDATVAKMNLPTHGLSQTQLGLKSSRIANTLGGCVGVVIGCLLGMSCLLFMDTDRADRMKKAKELTSIFESVMDDGHKLINAERCTLWMLDSEKNELWSRVATGTKKEIRISDNTSSGNSAVGSCVQSGEVVTINDAYKDDRFNPDVDKELNYRTRSIIAVPVTDEGGKVVGAIQMINKKNSDGTYGAFDINDVKMVKMLSSHVSHFIKIVSKSD